MARAIVWLVALPAIAAPQPAKWTAVRTPHFTVLTSGKASSARLWAVELERFRVGLGEVMPANAARLEPVVVLVFPNEKAFAPYKLLQNGKPAQVGGFFVRTDNVNAIALAQDFQVAETRRIIFHEATHWFLNARDDVLPIWLEEGIAEVFSTFAADDRQFTIGDLVPEHVADLRKTGVPPLADLVVAAREKLDYDDRKRTGKFYAGSWLFVHWAMFGQQSAGSEGLRRYLDAIHAGQPPAEAFRLGFGGDFGAVGAQLARYVRKGDYVRHTYPLPAVERVVGEPSPATEAEVAYAQGALLLGAHGPADALPHLQRAVELDPAAPRVWEALAAAQLHSGKKPEAMVALDRAIQAGSRAGIVWSHRGALRQELAGVELNDSEAAREVLAASAADFRRAIGYDPQCEPAFRGLAGVVNAVVPFDGEDIARLELGRRSFPEDRWVEVGLAAARLRSDRPGDAEHDLRALIGQGALEAKLDALARNAVENAVLRRINRDVEELDKAGRLAELTARLSETLEDPVITEAARAQLRTMRLQADQIRRINDAVAAYNAGRATDALALLRALQSEPPATAQVHAELQRVWKEMAPAPTPR